ncbi:MAG: sigma 54-interacting transcriptional regulator [Propionibacteriaceae bacterium]|jgi:transcriptional regulator of acetoin/glycerol metabolism|nr:sigma 54-interacting transcriptional regulator [Propionibacteriaceae bacterium]
MSRCVIVGAVPEAVIELAEQECATTVRRALDQSPQVDGSHLILHVPTDADPIQCQDWLDAAADENARVGLTSAAGLTAEVTDLLFYEGVVYVMRLLNDGDRAVPEAVEQLLRQDPYKERPKDDDIPLGRFFTWTSDPVQYRIQRQLSLSSETMEAFLRQLRDAVLAMQTKFPPAVQKLKRTPPWDPSGGMTDSDKLPAGVPSLRDVYRLHETPKARALLHPGSGDDSTPLSEWSVPKLLIRGESGSGKTLVAEIVRDRIARGLGMSRNSFPYVTVNCAALTAHILTHELFGTAGGMFNDIKDPVVGLLAKAAYGVAFLDEIGDLDLSAQRGMLVYLQDGVIRPFGIDPFPGFVRVIAATNRDVPLMIERQQFRNDLNARFDFQIEIPSLREREESERERLIDFAALNPQYNPELYVNHISRNALDNLSKRDYSNGNFREMETVVHTAIAKARRRGAKCIRSKDLPDPAEPLTVRESDAAIIDLKAPPPGATIDVTSRGDIVRAAAFSNSPLLRTPDGSEYVITRECVFRHQPAPAPEQS